MKNYQTVTFKEREYNIDDDKTSKNLNQMQAKEIEKLNILLNDYKHLLESNEKTHKACINNNHKLNDIIKQYERDMKNMDRDFCLILDEKKILKKENTKIKNSIEMFFKLNETVIKEF